MMTKWDRLSQTVMDERMPMVRDMEIVRRDALEIITQREAGSNMGQMDGLWDGWEKGCDRRV